MKLLTFSFSTNKIEDVVKLFSKFTVIKNFVCKNQPIICRLIINYQL